MKVGDQLFRIKLAGLENPYLAVESATIIKITEKMIFLHGNIDYVTVFRKGDDRIKLSLDDALQGFLDIQNKAIMRLEKRISEKRKLKDLAIRMQVDLAIQTKAKEQ